MTLKVTDDEWGEWGEWAVLRVSGEMDLVTSPVLRRRVHEAVAEGRRSLVLDLSEVLFCDSSGVGVLIATRRLVRSCQGRLRLILPPGARPTSPTSTAFSGPSACAASSMSIRTSARPSTRNRARCRREPAPHSCPGIPSVLAQPSFSPTPGGLGVVRSVPDENRSPAESPAEL